MTREGSPRPIVVHAARIVREAVEAGDVEAAKHALAGLRAALGEHVRVNERELWRKASMSVGGLVYCGERPHDDTVAR
jgi:hypothetical protein